MRETIELPATRRRGRPSLQRAAEIGDAIVDATIDAFATHGIEFSMDGVAAAAGISKQSIYRRFPGKAELLVHALDAEFERGKARFTGELPREPRAALREFAWRRFDNDKGKINRLAIFLQAEALREEELRRRMLEWHGRGLDMIEPYVARMLAAAPCDAPFPPRIVAEMLSEMLSSASALLAWTNAPATAKRAVFDQRWQAFEAMIDGFGRADDPVIN